MGDQPEVTDAATGEAPPPEVPGACRRIADLPARGRVATGGFIEYVRYAAANQVPEFSASIVDAPAGPGGRRAPAVRMIVVWHGQRTVPGVEQGVWLRVVGAISQEKGITTMYDPNYEILASKSELQDSLTTKRQVKSHLNGKAAR